MYHHPPETCSVGKVVRSARTEAEAMLDGNACRYGISTDIESKPSIVIIGLAIRGVGAAAIVVDASEYRGLDVLDMLDKVEASDAS